MLEAGRQCMNLQPLRHGGSFLVPSYDLCDAHRRHQILLQRGQHGIGADLHFRIAGMIVTAGESESGDKKSGKTRQFGRTCVLEDVHLNHTPNRWRFVRALVTRAVNTSTMTTSVERVRPVGTTAV